MGPRSTPLRVLEDPLRPRPSASSLTLEQLMEIPLPNSLSVSVWKVGD